MHRGAAATLLLLTVGLVVTGCWALQPHNQGETLIRENTGAATVPDTSVWRRSELSTDQMSCPSTAAQGVCLFDVGGLALCAPACTLRAESCTRGGGRQ